MLNFFYFLPFFFAGDLQIIQREPEPMLPEDEGLDKLPKYPETMKLMGEFIRQNSGSVRFDAYMSEHLFGKGGFYSDRAKIRDRRDADFKTDATKPEFAELISLFLSDKSHGKDFLEIGGGAGVFKKSYLFLHPDTRYLSVDMSPRLSSLQRNVEEGGENKGTIIASGFDLPLADKSVDGTIFANELLDALPCRTFKVKNGSGHISIIEEAHVVVDGDNLRFEYKPAERDEFVIEYEKFLSEIQPQRNMKDGDVISASAAFKPLIREMSRVLDKGKILMIDYGFDDQSGIEYLHRLDKEQPYVGRDMENGIETILRRPYETDVTFEIDFPFCRWLLSKIPELEVESYFLTDLARDILVDHPELYGRARGTFRDIIQERRFSMLEVSKK